MNPPANTTEPAVRPPRRGSRLWWWVLAAFALQLAAWTAWFVIASHHRVAEVPLETGARR